MSDSRMLQVLRWQAINRAKGELESAVTTCIGIGFSPMENREPDGVFRQIMAAIQAIEAIEE